MSPPKPGKLPPKPGKSPFPPKPGKLPPKPGKSPPFPPKPGMLPGKPPLPPEPGKLPPKLPRPEGEVSTPRNAVAPMCTVDEGVPASIWLAIEDALVIGIANAWVAACAWPDCDGEPEEEEEAAVFMPMTSPPVLTSGPPE